MTSKEKILIVGASLGLALGLVLLFFGQLGSGSSQVGAIATVIASPISPELSDENCEKPCFPKDKQVMPEEGINLGQTNRNDGSSFANNTTVGQTMTMTDDLAAPVIHELVIADGIPTTAQQAVSLDVDATDPPPEPMSGVSGIRFTEYEYILSIGNWVPTQHSQWEDYAEGQENYPWTLSPTYGIRYLEAWAVDQAGNISWDARMGVINLLPSEQAATLSLDEVNFYRIYVSAGETLSATLTAVSGDPDLYIWGPNDGIWYSNSPTEGENLLFQAPETGTYQIEVHGHAAAEYKLNFGTSHDRVAELPGVHSKPPPREPTLPLDNLPDSSSPPPSNNLTPTPSATPWEADLYVEHQGEISEAVNLGEEVTYTIIVGNLGPASATNVSLLDDLPEQVEFISATASQGSCAAPNNNQFTCNLETLAKDENATVTLIVKPQERGQMTNTVNASNAVPDPNQGNNASLKESTINDNEVNMTTLMPNSGWNNEEVQLEMQGNGFTEPLTVTLGSTLLTVTEVSSDRIIAIVPTGLALGWYDITVDSPSSGSLSLSNAYQVLDREAKSYSVYLPITVR